MNRGDLGDVLGKLSQPNNWCDDSLHDFVAALTVYYTTLWNYDTSYDTMKLY